MTNNFLDNVNTATQKAVGVLRQIREDEKFSKFAREKFNEAGIRADSSKAEDMLDELYDIAYGTIEKEDETTGELKVFKKAKADDRIKAIKTFAEMVGGGLNEKQTNIQNNISGNFFLDMLSTKK